MYSNTKFAVAAAATLSLVSMRSGADEVPAWKTAPAPTSPTTEQQQSAVAQANAAAQAKAAADAQGGKGIGIGKGGAGGAGGQGGAGGTATGGNAAGGNATGGAAAGGDASAQGGTSGVYEHFSGSLGLALPPPVAVPRTEASTTSQTGKCSGEISFATGAMGFSLIGSYAKAGDSTFLAASDGVIVTYELRDKNHNVVKDKDGKPVTVTINTETCAEENRNQETRIETIRAKQHVAVAALEATKIDSATCKMAAFTVAAMFNDQLGLLGSTGGYKELAEGCFTPTKTVETPTKTVVVIKYRPKPKDENCEVRTQKVCRPVIPKGAAATPQPQ